MLWPRSNSNPGTPVLIKLTAVVFGLGVWSTSVSDPDLGWQILGGRWISEHHSVPRSDFINTFNLAWRDYHWLGQFVMYKGYQVGGFPLLQIALGVIEAATYLVIADIIWISLGSLRSKIVAVGMLLGAATLIEQVVTVRPQMLAILVLACVVRRMMRPPTRFEIPLLIAQTVLLANIHVYWTLVPAAWAIFRLPKMWSEERLTWRSASPLAVFALAGFVSPYTWENYAVLRDYMFIPAVLTEHTTELRSILSLGGWVPYVMLGQVALFGRTLVARTVKSEPGFALASVVGSMMAIRSAKFIPIWVLLSLPFVVPQIAQFVRRAVPNLDDRERQVGRVAILVLIAVGAISAARTFPPSNKPEMISALRAQTPITACKAIAELRLVPSHGRDHVRVLTHFNDGGWCRFEMDAVSHASDIRVTTDGRTQDAPAGTYEKSVGLYDADAGWQQTMKEWAPDAALMPLNRPLTKVLYQLPEWKVVYEDRQFAVFVPNDAR